MEGMGRKSEMHMPDLSLADQNRHKTNDMSIPEDVSEEEAFKAAELELDELDDILTLSGLSKSGRSVKEPTWLQDYSRGK